MIQTATTDQLQMICQFYQEVIEDLENRINFPKWTWGIHPTMEDLENAIQNQELILFTPDPSSSTFHELKEYSYPFAGAAIINSSWIDGGQIQWTSQDFMAIHLFAIHPNPALRSMKHGDAFLEEILDYIKDQNTESIRLDLIEGNWPADHLYLRHGFEKRGKGEYQPEGEVMLQFEYREYLYS